MTIPEGDALAVGLDHSSAGRKTNASLRRQNRATRVHPVGQLREEGLGHDRGILERSIGEFGTQHFQFYLRACQCIERSQYHVAIALLIRVLNRDPSHADAWNRLGFAFGELGRHRRAIECFDHAIDLRPEWATPLANRGWNRMKINDLYGALEDLHRCVEIAPTLAYAWSHLGSVYLRLKQPSKAVDAFDRATKAEPDADHHAYMLAIAYAKTKDRDSSVRWLRKACELNPFSMKAWLRLIPAARHATEWPRADSIVADAPNPVELQSLHFGTVVGRGAPNQGERASQKQERLDYVWSAIQNPVAWIAIFIVAALVYTLLGN